MKSVTYAPTRILDGVKSLSYASNMLAGRLAREQGFDDALLVTPHGRVLEAPTSSIFWVQGEEILTPPLDDHILASITRALVLQAAGALERACPLERCWPPTRCSWPPRPGRCSPWWRWTSVSSTARARHRAGRGRGQRADPVRARRVKVLTVIGNRPQFIKAAAVSPRLREAHEELLVHTGQHFDDTLSAIFFAELGLPAPDEQLGVALGTSSSQTARMLEAMEPVLKRTTPDVVLVYGDTNSTLAGALAGAQAGVPVAHVEAGMRSFDRSMPEELNRVLVDHASALLLCSTRARWPTCVARR